MTALPADIAAGTREATIGGWENQAVKDRYPGARDAYTPPAEGFFDRAADAQVATEQRAALLGVERRRFNVPVNDLLWPDPAAGLPTYRLVDDAQSADLRALPGRIEIDLEAHATNLELFG